MGFATEYSACREACEDRSVSIAREIGSAVLSGILLEVSAHPKPGLVAPLSMGAHRDMDLQTFMVSSAAIAPCLVGCAEAGLRHEGAPEELLVRIRAIGRDFETRLLHVTHGVNTQRGALFSSGLVAAAAGLAAHENQRLVAGTVLPMAARIARGLCARELSGRDLSEARSAGEVLFRDYGVLGIRGEAETGFPTVAEFGLPALREALGGGNGLNRSLVHALMALIAETEDTTVLWRSGPSGLAFLQAEARRILAAGGGLTERGLAGIERLNLACIEKNISPGGAADLLAVTVAMYLMEHGRFPGSAMVSASKDRIDYV